jgi:hypothetical protein
MTDQGAVGAVVGAYRRDWDGEVFHS